MSDRLKLRLKNFITDKELSSRFLYLIIFLDLFNLVQQYHLFYSRDSGAWPLELATKSNLWLKTVGESFSYPWEVTWLLFVTAFAILLYGLLKKTSAVGSVVLSVILIFIFNRNRWILDAGDDFIIIFLLWHAAYKGLSGSREKFVTKLFALQFILIYVGNSFAKSGPTWNEWGTALNIIWGQDYISYSWIQNLSHDVNLSLLTKASRYSEMFLPFLLLFGGRFWVGGYFILYHLMISATVKIGLFPWVNIAGWLLFLLPPKGTAIFFPRRNDVLKMLLITWITLSGVQVLSFTLFKWEIPRNIQKWIYSANLNQKWGMFSPDPRFTSYRFKFQCLKKNVPVECGPETLSWEATESWGRRKKQYMIKLAERKNGHHLHRGLMQHLCSINPHADEIRVSLKASILDLKNPKNIKVVTRAWPVPSRCKDSGELHAL